MSRVFKKNVGIIKRSFLYGKGSSILDDIDILRYRNGTFKCFLSSNDRDDHNAIWVKDTIKNATEYFSICKMLNDMVPFSEKDKKHLRTECYEFKEMLIEIDQVTYKPEYRPNRSNFCSWLE